LIALKLVGLDRFAGQRCVPFFDRFSIISGGPEGFGKNLQAKDIKTIARQITCAPSILDSFF
jgi:hypothetical protein